MKMSDADKKKFAQGVQAGADPTESDYTVDIEDDIISREYPGYESQAEKKDDKEK